MPAPHTPRCTADSDCRCAPNVQCPAVLVDGDSVAYRCYFDPDHTDPHESDEGWGWTDPHQRRDLQRRIADPDRPRDRSHPAPRASSLSTLSARPPGAPLD